MHVSLAWTIHLKVAQIDWLMLGAGLGGSQFLCVLAVYKVAGGGVGPVYILYTY